jgi:hypothetical protein
MELSYQILPYLAVWIYCKKNEETIHVLWNHLICTCISRDATCLFRGFDVLLGNVVGGINFPDSLLKRLEWTLTGLFIIQCLLNVMYYIITTYAVAYRIDLLSRMIYFVWGQPVRGAGVRHSNAIKTRLRFRCDESAMMKSASSATRRLIVRHPRLHLICVTPP